MSNIFFICLFFLVHNTLASYDYFTLAETWPPTYCKNKRCVVRPPPNMFTIHGLWPSNHSGTHPYWCRGTFDRSKMSPLLSRLQHAWPSLSGNDYNFWDAEWRKHGTCSLYQQVDYFQLAFNIWAKYNIVDILSGAGMSQGSRVPYDKNRIVNAIRKHTGADPQLYCTNNTQPKAPYADLAEIRLCLDNRGAKYIPCPASIGCGSSIYWPA